MRSKAFGKIIAGMATRPSRESGARSVAKTILKQVDLLVLHLDGYSAPPKWAIHPRIIFSHFPDGSKLGSAGKLDAQDFSEPADIVITVDDDIIVHPQLVQRLVERLSRHDGPLAVGIHGSILVEPFTSYLKNRRVIHLSDAVAIEMPVDIIATCAMAFRVQDLSIPHREFPHRNMTDLQAAIEMVAQGVRRVLVSRSKNWMRFLGERQPDSIYRKVVNDDRVQTMLALQLLEASAPGVALQVPRELQ